MMENSGPARNGSKFDLNGEDENNGDSRQSQALYAGRYERDFWRDDNLDSDDEKEPVESHKVKSLKTEYQTDTDPTEMATKLNHLTPQFYLRMLMKMRCQLCGKMPIPNVTRFLCPDGHQLCHYCGENNMLTYMGKCKVETVGFNLCQNEITEYPTDPLFFAIWSNAQWKCPFQKFGCKEILKGAKLLEHMPWCEFATQEEPDNQNDVQNQNEVVGIIG